MSESPLELALVRVEKFRSVGDFFNAHLALLAGIRAYLTERYPFPIEEAGFSLAMSLNGHPLVAINAVVHDLVRSQTGLGDPQRREIGQAVARLKEAECKTRILIVRKKRIQHAIWQELREQLAGVEVWNVGQLHNVEIPIRA